MKSRGFTLVEVLVAISIFAVIAAISYSTLGQYLLVREKLEDKRESLQLLQRFFTLMERDLRYVADRPVRDEYGDTEAAFIVNNEYGLDGEVLRFTTTQPDTAYPGLSYLQRTTWRLEDGDLYRGIWPFLDRDADHEPVEVLLLHDIDVLDMSFYKWDEDLGMQQIDYESINEGVPYGMELILTMSDKTTYRRVFDLANGQ